jgi:hypothetical protein
MRHIQEATEQRRLWHLRKTASTAKNAQCLTIFLDGMDQKKTDLPQLSLTKGEDLGIYQLKVRLIGGLLYFRSVTPFGFFFDGNRFRCDTNSNLECLRRILEYIGIDNLPETIYIQLDNTNKDNKNYIFLSFCAYLIWTILRIKVIEIYFLMVGHTHAQIDQMFSVLSIEELMECLRRAFAPQREKQVIRNQPKRLTHLTRIKWNGMQ